MAISRVDENFSCCESKLFQLVIAIISGYLVSVVEECLSCGQALQEVSAQGNDWLGNYYTNHIYKGKTKYKVGWFGRDIMEDACMICSQALFKWKKSSKKVIKCWSLSCAFNSGLTMTATNVLAPHAEVGKKGTYWSIIDWAPPGRWDRKLNSLSSKECSRLSCS